jgi:hypothetical protein
MSNGAPKGCAMHDQDLNVLNAGQHPWVSESGWSFAGRSVYGGLAVAMLLQFLCFDRIKPIDVNTLLAGS